MILATIFFAAASIVATVSVVTAGKRATSRCVESMIGDRARHSGHITGVFGPAATTALQTFLLKEGFPTGPVDGYFGRRTIRALQTYLQRGGYDVGTIDGSCGFKTVRAMQAWLTVIGSSPGPIDGRWGSRTTRALHSAVTGIIRATPHMVSGATAVDDPQIVDNPQASDTTPVIGVAVAEAGIVSTASDADQRVTVMGQPIVASTHLYPAA